MLLVSQNCCDGIHCYLHLVLPGKAKARMHFTFGRLTFFTQQKCWIFGNIKKDAKTQDNSPQFSNQQHLHASVTWWSEITRYQWDKYLMCLLYPPPRPPLLIAPGTQWLLIQSNQWIIVLSCTAHSYFQEMDENVSFFGNLTQSMRSTLMSHEDDAQIVVCTIFCCKYIDVAMYF